MQGDTHMASSLLGPIVPLGETAGEALDAMLFYGFVIPQARAIFQIHDLSHSGALQVCWTSTPVISRTRTA